MTQKNAMRQTKAQKDEESQINTNRRRKGDDKKRKTSKK